jgi:hypothetical protein
MPFAVSIAILGLVQAVLVALPASRSLPGWLGWARSPWWALVPALSIAVVIAIVELDSDSATWLSYLALVAVPPLAACALAALTRIRLNPRISRVETDSRSGRPDWLAPVALVVAFFALAWASPHSLAGEVSATALSGLACIALGWLLVSVVPSYWLRLGVYAMAVIDTWFVASDLLQGPNAVLSAAAPAADLPRLQAVHFGSALMGFGDLFVAALVGCLLAHDRPRQIEGALLVAALALTFDLLFFAVDQLPATVPVAVALFIVTRRGPTGSRRDQVASEPG